MISRISYSTIILTSACLSSFLFSCNQYNLSPPFLSSLQANKNSPIYTTYAAAMERSEFTLDEGYEFHFYSENRGIDFTTDTGGEIGLGFVINGKWIYKEKDMFKKPVIEMSYPDLVKYSYYPIEGLKVEAFFLVQSSHAAILDLNFTNELSSDLTLEIIPFIRNDHRYFFDVENLDSTAFSFYHEEFPDGWTISHDLPVVDTVRNIFLVSHPSEPAIFNSELGEEPVCPIKNQYNKPAKYQVSGRAHHQGQRVMDPSPDTRIQIYLNKRKDRLITENSPLFGTYQKSVNRDGYFRMELGNFDYLDSASEFTLTFYSTSNNAYSKYKSSVSELPGTVRNDVHLENYNLPEIPSEIKLNFSDSVNRLSWTNIENKHRIYRRDYPESTYNLLTVTRNENSYTDKDIQPDQTYGYIIVAENDTTIGIHSNEIRNIPKSSLTDYLNGKKPEFTPEIAKILSFRSEINLKSNSTSNYKLVRMVARPDSSTQNLREKAENLLNESRKKYIQYNENLFSQVPEIVFQDKELEMLYWSAFNMMRQVFLPPEGKSSHNYYVFSREPTWGWGHGGQVFHESITMLAYAHLDPQSAMSSQKVYRERQYENGYINYRTGSYLDEIIEHNGQLTSSAPWYAWQNWEVYKISGDKEFLEEMYESSKKFYRFFVENRDSDDDGLCEWGGHAVLESVRDALVVVWDEVDWPSNFEGVDVNSMLVMEAKSLEAMARELGKTKEAEEWRKDHEQRAQLINDRLWDDATGFYYNIDKNDHDFSFHKENDLKRQEIIGFLPLWAGIVPDERAEILIEKLLDENKFWRTYGVPTLSADDPYYNDKGYWNGPVWVEWNLFISQALLNYGYKKEAKELVDRVAKGMILQLKKNHNLWEFYSPDEPWAGYHKTYIWAGVINRMLLDVYREEM